MPWDGDASDECASFFGVYSCKSVLGMPQLARDDDCGVLLLLPLWPAATPPGEGRGVDTESVGECAKDGEEKNCGRSFSLAHRPPGGWCAASVTSVLTLKWLVQPLELAATAGDV